MRCLSLAGVVVAWSSLTACAECDPRQQLWIVPDDDGLDWPDADGILIVTGRDPSTDREVRTELVLTPVADGGWSLPDCPPCVNVRMPSKPVCDEVSEFEVEFEVAGVGTATTRVDRLTNDDVLCLGGECFEVHLVQFPSP